MNNQPINKQPEQTNERITQYHFGIPVIPKSKIREAAWKLARYEDMENQGLLEKKTVSC